MEADERRRREQEALSAAVSNPFGGASSVAAAGSPTAKASAPPPAPSQNLHVGSNRAEKYLPALPLIDSVSMGKGRVRELESAGGVPSVVRGACFLAGIDRRQLCQ